MKRRDAIFIPPVMKPVFPIVVIGTLFHAFSATLSQFLLALFYDGGFKSVPFVIYSMLVIAWPLWGVLLWKFAKIGLKTKSAATAIIGLLVLSPVLLLVAYFYLGHEISDNFFLQ